MRPLDDDAIRHPARRRDLLARGVTGSELRGPLWRRAYRDRYVWSALPVHDPVQRARAAASLLPAQGALGGWAAAFLLGATALDGVDPRGMVQPVLLCLPPDQRVLRRTGIETMRSTLASGDVVSVSGLAVTRPLRTAFDLLRRGTLEAGVIAADAILHAGLVAREPLARYIAAHPRARGAPQARTALDLADEGAENPMETLFRLAWLRAGLPRPRANWELYSLGGQLLARADLLDEAVGLVGEFDGEVHAGRGQRSRDYRRQSRLEGYGLVVVRAATPDVLGDGALLSRDLVDGHRRAARGRGPRRWVARPRRAASSPDEIPERWWRSGGWPEP